MTKVSVIVPIYNTKRYLYKCIDSIINQTFKELEIILVDDGSTDGSSEVCDEYAGKDERIKVIHQENKGLVYSRYIGVSNAAGEYIGFVDSDDWIAHDMYAILMSEVDKKQYDIVSMGYTAVYSDGRKDEFDDATLFGDYRGKELDGFRSNMMCDISTGRRGAHPALWSKVIRRSLLMDAVAAADKRITLGEDAAIFYPCCLKAESIYIMRGYKYYYRIHSDSMCRSVDIGIFQKIYYFKQYMQTVLEKYDDTYNLLKQLKVYTWSFIEIGLEQIYTLRACGAYRFPYELVEKGSSIILYGAGNVGRSYYRQIQENSYCDIAAWADKCGDTKGSMIMLPNKIPEYDYSKIVLAVANEKVANVIIKELHELGISKNKIVWSIPQAISLQIL